jgi:hypothetical protein
VGERVDGIKSSAWSLGALTPPKVLLINCDVLEIVLFFSRETYTQHSIHSCGSRNHQTELDVTTSEGVTNRCGGGRRSGVGFANLYSGHKYQDESVSFTATVMVG